jgi:hypothetical protein
MQPKSAKRTKLKAVGFKDSSVVYREIPEKKGKELMVGLRKCGMVLSKEHAVQALKEELDLSEIKKNELRRKARELRVSDEDIHISCLCGVTIKVARLSRAVCNLRTHGRFEPDRTHMSRPTLILLNTAALENTRFRSIFAEQHV